MMMMMMMMMMVTMMTMMTILTMNAAQLSGSRIARVQLISIVH